MSTAEGKVLIELENGKKVIIKKPKVSDSELAAQRAGTESKIESPAHFGMVLQRCLVKQLLVSVNDNDKLSSMTIDELFDPSEYAEILEVVSELTGKKQKGQKPKVTFL